MVEVGSDGKRMRTLYDGSSSGRGVWTPDGKYLLYQDDHGDIRQDIWAIPMGKSLFRGSSRPIQLTAGPLSYSGLSVSRDGKQVFAIGTMERGELVRYDMKSRPVPAVSLRDFCDIPDVFRGWALGRLRFLS